MGIRSIASLLFASLFLVFGHAQSFESLFFEFNPAPDSGERAGHSVASAGDVNNDGHEDVVVGMPGSQVSVNGLAEESGRAVVYSGLDGSVLMEMNTLNIPGGTLQTGGGPGGIGQAGGSGYRWFHFGRVVAGVGDVNGDDHDDVAVAASKVSGNFARATKGSVSIFSGKDGSLLFFSEGMGMYGWSVAGLGDLYPLGNPDGYDDFAIGQPFEGDGMHLEQAQTTTHGNPPGGGVLPPPGPVQMNTGRIRVFAGGEKSYLEPSLLIGRSVGLAQFQFPKGYGTAASPPAGAWDHDFCGMSVGLGGDMDGDGKPDIVVGCTRQEDPQSGFGTGAPAREGAIKFVSSASRTIIPMFDAGGGASEDVSGLIPDGHFGFSQGYLGDFFHSGVQHYDAVVVGAPNADQFQVISFDSQGRFYRTVVDTVGLGLSAGSRFGHSVAILGDVVGATQGSDPDGHPDFAVGAPNNGGGGGYFGLFSGKSLHPDSTIYQTATPLFQLGTEVGHSLAALEDSNCDGRRELVVGAPGYVQPGGVGKPDGRVTVLNMKDMTRRFTANPLVSISGLGGQSQVLEFEFQLDPSLSGSNYVVGGSTMGPSPGFDLQGFLVPLKYQTSPGGRVDPYFRSIATNPMNAVLGYELRGELCGGGGKAQIDFSLPVWQGQSVGFQLHHALVVFDDDSTVRYVEPNAVSTNLNP